MAGNKTISNSFVVNTVEDGISYNINLSADQVTFNSTWSSIEEPTNGIVCSAKKIDAALGVTTAFGGYLVRNKHDSVIAQSSSSSTISYTIPASTLLSYVDSFPLTVQFYIDGDTSKVVAQGNISKCRIGEKGVDGKTPGTLSFNPAVFYYDADNGGFATSSQSITVYCAMYVDSTAVSTFSTLDVSIIGTTTSGASIPGPPSPSSKSFGLTVSNGASPECQARVVVTGVLNSITYRAEGYIPIVANKTGPQGGSTSSLSKMYYYAGPYSSTKTYSLTETQAPYVMQGDQFYVMDNAANGGAARNVRNVTPTNNGDPWTLMASEMKYYIAEAAFASFAKLGSAIFSGDFMLSQYGKMVGYGDNEIIVNNSNYYQYADPNNMLAEQNSYLHLSNYTTTVSNTDYNEELSRFSYSFNSSIRYMMVIDVEATSSNPITIKLAPSYNYWESIFEETITENKRIIKNINTWSSETYKLYYKRGGSSSTNPKITYSLLTNMSFRPNVFIDYKKGFLYANQGRFQDVTVEGKINNLITVIDWNSNIGRDKIITAYYKTDNLADFDFSYTETGSYTHKRYYIDVLNCGDFIYINSLPETGGSGNYIGYHLPYYALSNLQDRGHTRDEDGDPHIMTSDEMRQLIGRKLTFKINLNGGKSSGQYYTRMVGMLDLEPFDSGTTKWIANKKNYFKLPVPGSSTPNYQELSVGLVPQVIHMECLPVTWTNNNSSVSYSGYGYVWVGDAGIDATSSPTADSINW